MQASARFHHLPRHMVQTGFSIMLTIVAAIAVEDRPAQADPPISASALAVCESTGFEASEGPCGWELGWICGSAFTNCPGPPYAASCTGNPATDFDCCIANPNPLNGWYLSGTNQHCAEPHIADVNPASGAQHLRFTRDAAGGNPPGCSGFTGACRINAFTPSAGAAIPLGPVHVDMDVAMSHVQFDSALKSSLTYFTVDDAAAGLSLYLYFHYYGLWFVYDYGIPDFAFAGDLDGLDAYNHFSVDLNPCTSTIDYYVDGLLQYSTAVLGGSQRISRGIFSSNNISGYYDVDNYVVIRDPECSYVCGNNVAEPTEECDGTDSSACPGFCRPPGDPLGECTCSQICGNAVREGTEQCDGTDDAACPGLCSAACTCAVCGNSLVEGPEECDGTNDAACPGFCRPPADPLGECTCSQICGNAVREGTEQCDGSSDVACPGLCNAVCTCLICGDSLVDAPEECDGANDASCPGDCRPPGHALGGCKCPRGACCKDGTACTDGTTPAGCENLPPFGVGGVFLGDGTKCATQNAVVVPEGGGQVFVHVIGPPVTCETLPPLSRGPCPPGGPYIDAWASTQDGSMCHNFGAAETNPIPAGFFGLGSDAFAGVVCLRGESLQIPEFGPADTLIERSADPFDRCSLPSPTTATVDIEIVALNLVSTAPITVTYGGGPSEQWDVSVDLSPAGPIPGTPPSTLTALKTHCNGGTYTSVLYVQPRFTFKKVGDPGAPVVLDTGQFGMQAPAVELSQTDPHPWVADIDAFLAAVDPCSHFHANVEETPQGNCDCNANSRRDLCDIEDGFSLDCNTNGAPDSCDISNATSLDVDPTNGVPDECDLAPFPLEAESGGVTKNRFVGVVVPPSAANRGPGTLTALRVVLTTLNHSRLCCSGQDGNGFGTGCEVNASCDVDSNCTGGTPMCRHQLAAGTPNYSAFEGNIRYVNSFAFPTPGGSLVCVDDGPPFNTTYRCATLGCDPEYRDWATDLSVAVNPAAPSGLLYITGDAMIPSSTMNIAHIAASCGAAPSANTCSLASAALALGAGKWGDITSAAFGPPDSKSDVLDIPAVTNKLKGVPTFFSEPRTWLKQRDPAANTDAITVVDLSDVVDGVLARPYPASRTIDSCPHD
jgi:hypothetical protein